jgi:choline monooxygenase
VQAESGVLVSDRVDAKRRRWEEELAGLVPTTPSPMLQPWEVWDQDLFDLEMVRVFARAWVWIGDTEDLTRPGDYITGRIGYQGVVIIRGEDGSVRGFLNNCRHRASGLAFEAAGNCGHHLTCPYHNWSYALDGRLVNVPDRERMYGPEFDPNAYGLIPVRVHVAWDKLVFACLSHRTPPFAEWIAPIAPRYERYGISGYRRFHRDLDETYPINWKAFCENSNDDYHVRFVHRRLNKDRKQLDTVVRFAGRTTSGYKPHPDHVDLARGRTDLADTDLRGHYADFIYPNLTPLPYPTQLILVRADPIAPDRTRLFSRIYGLTGRIDEQEAQLDELEATNAEDTAMVTVLMDNLRSPLYRVGPVSAWERRAGHVMGMVRDDVTTPLAPDEFTATSPQDPHPRSA